jgi:predicted nucleotidyltransferase
MNTWYVINIMEKNEIIIILRRFKNMNRDKYSIKKIGIFGSATRENLNEQSDIDVVVVLEKPDLLNIIGIKQDLEEQFHQSVDVVRYRPKMNQFLKQRIDKEAVYV